jgi:hypothetical protein
VQGKQLKTSSLSQRASRPKASTRTRLMRPWRRPGGREAGGPACGTSIKRVHRGSSVGAEEWLLRAERAAITHRTSSH